MRRSSMAHTAPRSDYQMWSDAAAGLKDTEVLSAFLRMAAGSAGYLAMRDILINEASYDPAKLDQLHDEAVAADVAADDEERMEDELEIGNVPHVRADAIRGRRYE